MLSSYVNNGRGYVTLLGAANTKINFLNGETLKHLYITSDTADQEINGASDIDYLINFSSGATVNANSSRVYSNSTALINGLSDNDTIINAGDNSTINVGAGNDSIYNEGSKVSINAGAGDDTIANHGSSVTINGGTGNDYIYGNVVQYAEGDGNDTVVWFSESSTLNISAGAIGSASTDGIAAVIRVGDGSIRLNRMAGRNFKLMDADGNVSTTMIGDVAYTPDEGGSFENSTNGKIIKIAGGDTSVTLNGSKQIIDCEADESNITIYGYDADDTVRISDWHFSPPEIDGNDVRLVSNWEGGGSITFKNVINKKITLISKYGTDLYVMPGGATINNDIDYVENYTDGVSISLGSGVSEFINLDNCADNVTVNAVGKAYIRHGGGSNVSIKTGAGNDNIDSFDVEGRVLLKNNVTIDAGDGDNSIRFNGETGEGLHSRNLNIKAGRGNDQISVNRVDNVSLDAGDGNNDIGTYSDAEIEDVTIKSGSGSDNLSGSFVNADIDLGDGDNDIGGINGYNITLKTGADDDNFYVSGRYISIDAGDGNNVIDLSEDFTSNPTLKSGAGNDLLRASSVENVMVNAGAGNDTIAGDFKGATLNAGKDNDLVSITGDGGWLYQYANGDGNDTIDVSGSPNGAPGVIHVTSGSVSSVTRNGNNAVVNVGSGSIVLNGYANFDVPIAIKDSAGDVSLWYKNGSSLTKFDGDSTVRNGVFINTANNVLLDELSVENVINYGDNVTIDVDEGTAVTLNGSSQVIRYGYSYQMALSNISGLGDDDTIYVPNGFNTALYSDDIDVKGKRLNFSDGKTVTSILINDESNVPAGGTGIDYVINKNSDMVYANGSTVINQAENANIRGFGDNDSIINNRDNVSIGSGAGNDTIENSFGNNIIINGGVDDDLILFMGSGVIEYADGDGNDTVLGFNSGETIRILYGTIDSGYNEGFDTVLKIGDGSIRLKNAAGESITVQDSLGNVTSTVCGNVLVGTDQADTLESTIDNAIVKPLSGDDVVSLKGAKQIVDYEGGNDTVYGLDADDTVRIGEWIFESPEMIGNDLRLTVIEDYAGEDGGSLTLKDIANKKITMVNTGGDILYVMPGGATVANGSGITGVENYVDNALVSLGGDVSRFYSSYTSNVTVNAGGGDNEIRVGGDIYAEDGEELHSRNVNVKAGEGNDYIVFQGVRKVSIDAGDDGSYISHGWQDSAIIEDITIKGGSGGDQINGTFVNANIDAGDGDNAIGEMNTWNLTLKAGSGNDEIYLNGTDISVDAGDGNNIIGISNNEDITKNVTVKSGSGKDTIDAGGVNVVINSGSGDDSITNIRYDTSINAGEGDDYISGYLDRSTINAGKGNDTVRMSGAGGWLYQYANGDGNDTIDIGSSDSAVGIIHVTSGNVSSVVLDGSNAVINVGSGSIVLNGFTNFNVPLAIKDSSGNVALWYKDGDALTKFDGDSTIRNDTFINVANNAAIDQPVIVNYGSKNSINLVESDELYQPTVEVMIKTDLTTFVDGKEVNFYVTQNVPGQLLTNYGDDATINVGSTSYITLNGARQVINVDRSFSYVYGLGADDTVYSDYRDWLEEAMTQKVSGNNIEFDYLTLYDAVGKKLNFASGDSVTSMLFANDWYAAGGKDIDYVINLNSLTVTANGSTVINKGAESRVIGWSDDDAIINLSAGSKTSIHTGDGNDTVYGFGSGDTLNIIYGSISGGHTEGNDTVLEIGDGSIRLKNTAGNSITVRDANGSVTSNAYANIIEGTDEADTLASTITGVIFKPYEGDDIVSLNGSYQIVEYLSGSDTIYGYREGDIIRLENYWGFDSFEKSGNDMVIANVETEESLTFKNVGNKKIMMLSSDGKTRYIMSDATVDNDSEVSTVENYIDGVNVSLDTGVSQFYNKGDNVTVSAAGEIEFENANGNNVLFRSGAGSDTIDLSSADGVTIDAGDGDNNFNLNGLSNGVVSAGSGNDFIDGEAVSNVSINLGDGNNEIMVSSEQDPFINVTIKSGSDDDRIDDKFINSNIDLGDGNNEVYDLMGENITLKTGAGNDTIRTSNLSILASSINASAGDDTIYIEHNTMYIDPNDVFRFTTVVGGKGNDTFQAYNNSNWIYQYANGDGDDEIIYSRSSFDGLIQLTDGSISDVSLEGSSFVIKVGSGSLTVSRNYNNSLFVKNAQGDFSAWYVDNIDDKALSLANTSYFVDYQLFNGINNYGSNVVINSDAEGAADFIFNYGSNVTVNGGAGNDTVVLAGAEQVVYYAEGDGNDTIFGVSSSDTIRVDGAFSTVESGDDLNVNVGDGSMKFVGGAGVGFRVIDAAFVPAADSLTAGIEYDPKKPSKLIVKDPFSGIVNAADFSDKITLIDATSSNRMVVLKAGAKSTVIEAGKGESTLIGGGKDDKLYGGDGVNTFVYTVGEGKDAVYDYEAKDIISIAGATRDKLIFTDKKDAVIINVDGDKKSQLTINKVVTTDALTIDMGGETFKYGELPTGVTFDDDKKKTVLKVGSTAEDGVIVDAAEIVSTAKTLDGTGASGSVHLIGNGNKNELKAGKHGSTLYGGKYNVADKLIGGDGADVFVYGTGDGADVITNFDGTEDVVMLNGVTSLKADNLKWSGDKLIVTVGSQKLTLEDPKGQVNFVNDSGTTLYSTGVNFPTGVSYNKGKTAIIVDGTAVDVGTIDLTSTAYVSTVKEINATAYGGEIEMIGGANADVLRAGSGVSTMNGGAGADKLYGGSGSDTFVYDGVGNDVIYQFDGTKDVVMLKGVTTLDPKNINVGANKIVVTVNGGKLTLDDPQGQVNFVNDSGTTLYSVGINFADGIGYNKGKTAITVDGSASDVGTIDLTSSAYVTTVKEINATAYGGELNLIGNANANVIRAGKGNATLNGGYDASKNKATSDKLYGTTTAGSSDVFVWDAFLGGGDQIYNYDAAAGDIISVTGANLTINKKDFKESGKNVVLSAGGGKLTINDVADKPIVVVYGDDTITYGSLDGGLAYVDNNKRLTIGDPFSGTIDADDYNAAVVTLDASAATDEITLIGNKKTKAMVGGSGSTTMIGSTANDNFHAGTGADVIVYAEDDGKDVVYNFDSGTDVIRLSDTTVAVTDFTEKGNDIIISVGKGSITLKNAPRGTYNVEYDGGSVSYTTLPQNTTYNAKKNVLTLTKDFSGALAASDVCVPIKEINGSAATGAINLTAGSTATKLTASKGGSTLTGGDGKDTLIGGNGADLFVTSGGDLIDKYTAGKDKIRITGTLTSGKVSGSNVELTTSEGTTTIKGVVGKEITLEIDGVESAYKFTKANNTLEKALISNGASQLPADAYWFMRTDDAIDELGSLIDGNTTADDTALAPLSQSFDPSSPVTNALTSTLEKARHLKK